MNRILLLLGVLGALVISWYSTQLQADRYGAVQYQGDCYIDPDNFFGNNEQFAGSLQGDLEFIVKECRVLAQMRFRSQFTFSFKNLSPVSVPRNRESTGVCHIDSDAQIDFDKEVVGVLLGRNLEDLFKQCSYLLAVTHRYGSFGVNQINNDRALNFPRSAECWVDDDAMYDPGHLLLGRVFGNSIQDMYRECTYAASRIYRYPYSAGLENIESH